MPSASFLTISLCIFTTLNRLLRDASAQPINQVVRRYRYVQLLERSNSMQAIKKRQTGHQNDRVEPLCSMLTLNQRCLCQCEVAKPPSHRERGA